MIATRRQTGNYQRPRAMGHTGRRDAPTGAMTRLRVAGHRAIYKMRAAREAR
jgi:hypothetical protein